MAFFHEELRRFLEEKLNLIDENVLFDVSLYFKKTNAQYTKLIEEEKKLRKKEVPFSLLHIERIEVSRVNLPQHNIVDAIVQSSVMIPTDKRNIFDNINFNSVYEALDKFILEYNAKTYPFGEIEYDMLVGGYDTQYETNIKPKLGFTIKFKDEDDYLIYTSGKNLIPNNLFTISKIGKTLVFSLRNVANTGYSTLTFDIEIDKNIEVVYEVDSDNLTSIIVDGVKKTTLDHSPALTTTNDTLHAFNGTLTDLYVQTSTFSDKQSYEDGLTTLEGLFDNPILVIKDFETLTNQVDNAILLTKFGTIKQIGSRGYATLSFDSVTPISGIVNMFGTDYQEYDFTFNVLLSQDTFMGNQVEYYLDNVRIYPSSRNIGLASESASEQMINKNIAESVNNATGLSHEFTLYYKRDKKLIELLDWIKRTTNKNTTYDLKIVFPTLTITEKVKIVDFGISPLEGEPLNYTIRLDIPADILYK